jgi:glutamine synthetase
MTAVYQKVIPYAQAMGLDMIEGDYEDDGQLELNWMFDRADDTCERMLTYRQICKQVARELGIEASFMPKPYPGKMGNGCHHNMSLWDGETNAMEDGRTELHVTDTARAAIAGVLNHAHGGMIFFAPTVNSYKRDWDVGQFAPSRVNWGFDSRGSAVRISANGRMEFRIPDASCNPFLTHLVILLAMEDGLVRGLDCGQPTGLLSQGEPIDFGTLPGTLGEAIECFKADALLSTALPRDLTDVYLELKTDEWARYCGAITDFDFDTYWEAIP